MLLPSDVVVAVISGIPMPAYADAAGFALAGWILFFFAAAIGSGNFPGEASKECFRLKAVTKFKESGVDFRYQRIGSQLLPHDCRSRVARTSTRCISEVSCYL